MSSVNLKDEKLVRLLGQDARQNSETLAKKLKLSSATVRRRLRRLLQSDSLRIIGVVNPRDFGLPVAVVIALDIAHDKLESAVRTLAKRSEITWAAITTGRFDMLVLAWFPSTDSLSNFLTKELAQIEGVRDSETLICLDVKKGRYTPLTG